MNNMDGYILQINQKEIKKQEIDPSLRSTMKDVFSMPRILVVDDETRIQKACARLLAQEGCEVEIAENGLNGLKKIKERHFDIVLLDLMMPGMSGMEVLSSLKADHPDTVVIIITGYATLEHSIEAMKKGAFDFLSKPFSPQDLRLVITKALEFIQTLQDIAGEKSRMRVMINTLMDGVLTTDHKKRIALANPAFLQMMNCHKTSVIGSKVDDVIREPTVIDMIDRAMAESTDYFSEITNELSIRLDDDGKEMIIGVRSIPFRDRLNRNLGVVTVFHDITALKKEDKLKSDFVSMVAHEIKSPLNSILMQLKVILDGLAGDLTEKQIKILQRSSDKIRSLTELATELLDLSKIESGLINQKREELDLESLIADQVELYKPKADSKNITLIHKPYDNDIKVIGNKTNIEEVVSNLISNAIRYTPENGRIEVWVTEQNDTVMISIEDTGLGIPAESINNIFERFFRVKNEKTRFINGTGLGLAIVKSIVDAHHGSIHVESEVDKGTKFTVCFPKIRYEV